MKLSSRVELYGGLTAALLGAFTATYNLLGVWNSYESNNAPKIGYVFNPRGNSIVYVSAYAEVDSEPEARSLTQVDKGEREKSEMRRVSREFAKHMVTAIDLP